MGEKKEEERQKLPVSVTLVILVSAQSCIRHACIRHAVLDIVNSLLEFQVIFLLNGNNSYSSLTDSK